MAEDGEVLDSWEDQEDQGILDKRLNEMKVKAPKTATASVLAAGMREETARTEYQPQVRILKRDTVSPKTVNAANSNQAAKPMKTLEQREAEYAQARLRIFGSLEEPSASDVEALQGDERPAGLVQKFDVSPADNAVSRQPKGPDGTPGFNLER
ncbi:SUZ RNA-binding domain-containing-like [Haliotis cracherodii]|uniref:SUZ domain-containing protein 1-like n=1 Tax=Haliotis rufescens TaxID=6454 RepID=UPI001EB02906|nr:SUZ domain-containing protein 1-like [Haliotis rufescens]